MGWWRRSRKRGDAVMGCEIRVGHTVSGGGEEGMIKEDEKEEV